MRKLIVYLYNLYYQWKMRNAISVILKQEAVDVTELNTLAKILPILKVHLDLIDNDQLNILSSDDLFSVIISTKFTQYSHFTQWLSQSLKTILKNGNIENTGYIDLDKSTKGYVKNPLAIHLLTWLPDSTLDEDGTHLNLFYAMVKQDINSIEKVMETVTDPYFNKYYDTKLATALQEILLVIYAVNRMVAFYEW